LASVEANVQSGSDVKLSFRGLSKTFFVKGEPKLALQNINTEIQTGEFVSIVGASGCGKSTLIRIAAGLEQASEGGVYVENNLVIKPGQDRGMVFQQFSLFPWLTVKENVMFGLQDQFPNKARRGEQALVWIERVGLGEFVDYYPNQLSGGMQQRVAIARALAPGPKVLLLDEPFAALDAQTRRRMQRHLLEIWRALNITVVFITHDLEEAILLADKIFVLAPNPGRLVAALPIDIPRTNDDLERDKYGPVFAQVFNELSSLLADSVSLDDARSEVKPR
jgi:NitT/TauT family transport system ATP-binding protein